jgi:hypothetical protein
MMMTHLLSSPRRRREVESHLVIAGAIFFLLVILPASSVSASITQADWARWLMAAMGVEARALPADAASVDYIEFLSGDPIAPLRVQASAAVPLPPGAQLTPDPMHPDRRWLRMGAAGGTPVFKVRVPASGVYAIRILIEGGEQRWRVDGGEPHVAGPADEGRIAEPTRLLGYFLLARGVHQVSVEIPPSGALAWFALVRQPFPHVRPPGGWQPNALLTFGVKAVTMVQAMQLEGELRDRRRWEIAREGEAFTAEGPAVVQTNDRDPGRPSADAWVRGAHGGSWVEYEFEARASCTYSLVARMAGRGSARWIVDDTVERHVTPPGEGERFQWLSVSTLPLAKGRHRVRVGLEEGAGLDVFKLLCRDPDPQASLFLLRDLGFGEKMPDEPVPASLAQENLNNAYFRARMDALLTSFFTLTTKGPGPWGASPPWDQGLLLPSPSEKPPSPVSPFIPGGP